MGFVDARCDQMHRAAVPCLHTVVGSTASALAFEQVCLQHRELIFAEQAAPLQISELMQPADDTI